MTAMPSAPLARASAAAADRLRRWLLSPAVQLRDGPAAGGVVGAFDADGSPRYTYPEIAGYYLHWLAELAHCRVSDGLDAHAGRSAAWAQRALAGDAPPQTRHYLVAAAPDWRNDASFFFDLAMLLRGLTAAAESALIPLPQDSLARLVRELAHFVSADGSLRAARPVRPAADLPARWSTCGGPFEVKASSRVLLAARHLDLPAALATACAREAERHAPHAATMDLDMLHPTLYFAEGLLLAQPQRAPALVQLLDRCLSLQRADGSLPEAASGSDLPRSDIIAQALRLGLLLHSSATLDAARRAHLDALVQALLARVGNDGTLAFVPGTPAPQPNVWCGLFAEQALRWYARWSEGQSLPTAEWLV